MTMSIIAEKFSLAISYGSTCLGSYFLLYAIFKFLLPSRKNPVREDDFPWKVSASLTANRIVAFFVMIHWTCKGLKHIWEYDYSAPIEPGSNYAASVFVPAGFDIAQCAMGALIMWDIPVSLFGGAGPGDIMMHLHHAGMVLVTACVLGIFGPIVGTHVAPIFLGAIELSSIPLQIVDLFHPKKSPHWKKYASENQSGDFFPKFCSSLNEVCRILFAILFLLVRGICFPFAIASTAVPDFYEEGSLPSMILLVMSVLFTLLQMYWATLVFGQVKKALLGDNANTIISQKTD